MKIIKMLNQHRRDFSCEMECENCQSKTINKSGYDYNYYHENVIPNMKCKDCGESTISSNKPIEPQATKYPDGYVI